MFNTVVRKRVRKKSFQCEVCLKWFSSRLHANDHFLIHTGEKPHVCDVCDKKFSQKSNLKRHLLVHTQERRFNCDICFKTFAYKQHFQQHLRVQHTGEKPYECEICERRFAVRMHLKGHMMIHTGLKPFTCKVCGMKFRSKRTLKSHTAREHSGKVILTYACDGCKRKFATEKALQDHSVSHKLEKSALINFEKKYEIKDIDLINLINRKKSYECHICAESLKNEKDLQNHIQNHELLSSFICYQCEIKFANAYDLIKHLRSCMGKKSSVNERNAQKHLKNCEVLKPFVCYQCDTGFNESYDLIKHLRTCTGKTSHSCSISNREFTDKETVQHNTQITTKSLQDNSCGETSNSQIYSNSNLKGDQEGNKENSDCQSIKGCSSSLLTDNVSDTGKLDANLNTIHKENFTCETCEKEFTEDYLLNEHRLTHVIIRNSDLLQCDLNFECESSKEELFEEYLT